MKFASLALAVVIAAAAVVPASAAGKSQNNTQIEDISASKKRVRAPIYQWVDPTTGEVVTRYRVLTPSSDFDGGDYAGEYAWRKSIGQCVEDLGYGRWKAC